MSSIEFALIEKDVLFGLSQGNQVLKELNKEMSLDKVEKLMDETAEGIAYQKEVSDLLASRITVDDEAEVQAELAALEAEALKSSLPQVPAEDIKTSQGIFDDRLEQLNRQDPERTSRTEEQTTAKEERQLVAA